jgi:hypothetical protein
VAAQIRRSGRGGGGGLVSGGDGGAKSVERGGWGIGERQQRRRKVEGADMRGLVSGSGVGTKLRERGMSRSMSVSSRGGCRGQGRGEREGGGGIDKTVEPNRARKKLPWREVGGIKT